METDGATRLGRYELLQELGSGGMATVHVARGSGPRGFERLFAVKCCHPHLRKQPGFGAMFLDEARLAAAIHHPNVVPVLDMGEEGDVVFLVMEYVDGERLSRLLNAARSRRTPLPVPVVVRLFRDVLAGLHAAHEATSLDGTPLCIVHRDVTPENVLVGVDGNARLIDFGIAKAAVREAETTQGVVKGKLAYLAPEQLGGSRVDRRVDLWAVGVSLWEALATERLFGGGASHGDVVAAVLSGAIAPPSSRNPDVPAELDAVVLRALRRDPEARFGTALEMAAALEGASIPVASSRDVSSVVQYLAGDVLDERRASLSRALEATPLATVPNETTDATAPFEVPRRRRALWAALTLAVAAIALSIHLAGLLSNEALRDTPSTSMSSGASRDDVASDGPSPRTNETPSARSSALPNVAPTTSPNAPPIPSVSPNAVANGVIGAPRRGSEGAAPHAASVDDEARSSSAIAERVSSSSTSSDAPRVSNATSSAAPRTSTRRVRRTPRRSRPAEVAFDEL